jgi:hypothetical protein
MGGKYTDRRGEAHGVNPTLAEPVVGQRTPARVEPPQGIWGRCSAVSMRATWRGLSLFFGDTIRVRYSLSLARRLFSASVCVQPFSIRIDDQRCKILHVSGFVVCTHTDFIKRVEGNGVGRACRFESQDTVVALGSSPAGRQLVNLAFEVSDNRAMRPCEHGRHNQADAFAAAWRRRF